MGVAEVSLLRMHNICVQQPASQAILRRSARSIPMFRADFLPFASKIVEHSRYLPKRCKTVCSCCCNTSESRALICVIPAAPDSAIPALQSTSPHTCGLLKWPKAGDTCCDHCDNRSGQGMFVSCS